MKYLVAIIFSIAIVLASYLLENAYKMRAHPLGVISDHWSKQRGGL
ncbi:MAG TPA: hypothetical protein VK833_10480 [Gillisia sp.]|nr:hypothetical protein [Gillisia sp.]